MNRDNIQITSSGNVVINLPSGGHITPGPDALILVMILDKLDAIFWEMARQNGGFR